MFSSQSSFKLTIFFLLIHTLCFISHALVPASATFKYVNDGEFGPYIVEYDPSYRYYSDIFKYPYVLTYYNTTPNEYYLGLRVGTRRSTSLTRWVWEFNRGNPVRENATLSLGTDGNLVLAEADGRVVWQSGTANKGVVGFELLSSGNMVLHDGKGKFLWQSFDYPTDTLVVGQSLRVAGSNKLISRASPQQNVNGPYSLVMEPKRFAMYYQTNNSPKPQLYFDSTRWITFNKESFEYIRLNAVTTTHPSYPSNTSEIFLDWKSANSSSDTGNIFLARTRYNGSITYLRLGIDGSFKTFTFDQEADISAWETTYDLFARNSAESCQLPTKCGNFGLCENGQCVACPSSNGTLLGWNDKCRAPRLKPSSSCGGKNVKYYKLVGVDHFTTKYTKGDGPMKESECSKKCSLDCKCGGYFYSQDESLCWIANDLMTLTKVKNSKHLAYIKVRL